jgi:hypothetical protein
MSEDNLPAAVATAETPAQQEARIKRNMIGRFIDRALNTHDNGLPKDKKTGYILFMFGLDPKGEIIAGTDIAIQSNDVKAKAAQVVLGAVYSGLVKGELAVEPATADPVAESDQKPV